MAAAAFGVAVWGMYAASLAYDVCWLGDSPGQGSCHDNIFTYRGFGGRFKYMTFWNHCIQTLYFFVCVLNNLCGSNVGPGSRQQRSSLQRLRDFFHASVVFPTGTFVVVTFWAIYAVDRELVYPKSLDKIIPPVMNHIMHTFVLPILVAEKALVYHYYPRRLLGALTLSFFALAYLFWILWIAYMADVWVYPVLKVLDGGQRTIFIGLCLVFFFSLYLTGEALTRFLWRKKIGEVVAKRQ